MTRKWQDWLSGCRRLRRRSNNPVLSDEVHVDLPEIRITVTRHSDDPTPHELHVIMPRVEIRRECTRSTPAGCRTEIVVNSLTIVDAPRQPVSVARRIAATSSQKLPPGSRLEGRCRLWRRANLPAIRM
ncbi:MAG: hypothetical protein IMX00_02675 [Limnochordales bacterium]|nr:hypothetical protein [Limnochordales bacterium]